MPTDAPQPFIAIFLGLTSLLFLVVWIVALVDLIRRPDWEFPPSRMSMNPRLVWSVIVVLLGGLGGLVYYLWVIRPYPRQPR